MFLSPKKKKKTKTKTLERRSHKKKKKKQCLEIYKKTLNKVVCVYINIVACTTQLMGWLLSCAHNLFVVVWVWISYNGKFLETQFFYLSHSFLMVPQASFLSFSILSFWYLTSKCSTPLSSSPPLFIGLLSRLVMIALNGFSCKCGPYGIILDKRESHFGNGCLSFGTRDWRWTLFSRRPPPRQPRYIGNRLRTMLDPEVVIVHGLPRVE